MRAVDEKAAAIGAALTLPDDHRAKREAFRLARRQGASIRAAARAVGVHEHTGRRWNKRDQESAEQAASDRARLWGGDELARQMQELMVTADPAVKVRAAVVFANVRGLNAPQRTENVTIVVHDGAREYLAWLRERRSLAATATARADRSLAADRSGRDLPIGRLIDVEGNGAVETQSQLEPIAANHLSPTSSLKR